MAKAAAAIKTQSDLLGSHPIKPNIFGTWLTSTDTPVTRTKRHRELSELIPCQSPNLVDWLARRLIHHHYDDARLDRLKQMYGQIGFPAYANQHRKLPRQDRTKKGNAIEVILVEYVEHCQNKTFTKHYKLRYNPNVDQAMKGDDMLLVDILKDANNNDYAKMYLGEAKFRATPTNTIVNEIASALAASKKPLSYSFLIDELSKNPVTKPTADILDKLLFDEIKAKGNVTYIGLLLSNISASRYVERTLNSSNANLAFISIGVNNPVDLVNAAFVEAERLLQNPVLI